jgi:hypothetical protein
MACSRVNFLPFTLHHVKNTTPIETTNKKATAVYSWHHMRIINKIWLKKKKKKKRLFLKDKTQVWHLVRTTPQGGRPFGTTECLSRLVKRTEQQRTTRHGTDKPAPLDVGIAIQI